MKVSRHRLSRLIATRSLKQGVNKRFAREVAAYLLSERRTSELNSILRDVQADWAAAGFVEAVTTTAHPLTNAVRNDIKRQLKKPYAKAKRIDITEVHDPEIIAGLRLDLPNQQLDLSAQAKLNQLKQATLSGKGSRG